MEHKKNNESQEQPGEEMSQPNSIKENALWVNLTQYREGHRANEE